MCKNVIFLDIDGVLNNDACIIIGNNYADLSCVTFLIEAIKNIDDVKIVISSSWRTNTLERFKQKINQYNADPLCKLIEFFHDDWRTKKLHTQLRGHEIDEWLSRHTEVLKFICIDDDTDFLENQPVLQTDCIHGFGHTDAKLISMFFTSINSKNIEHICESTNCQKNVLNNRMKFIDKYLSY